MKKQDKKFSQYFYEQNFKVEKFSAIKNNEQNKDAKKSLQSNQFKK